ncbi:hypothetical protein BJ742DRAFT_708159 [Cladochytrium replicatum]|nr:hypothetical protein BJ742DRAFT_708159 [Cladochytrium replicatum]
MSQYAVVLGGTRGIGAALIPHLLSRTPYTLLVTGRAPSQSTSPRVHTTPVDYTHPTSLATAASLVPPRSLRLLINCVGMLEEPEKALKKVDYERVRRHFEVNALGALMAAKEFEGCFGPVEKEGEWRHPVLVNLSARTGSIGDNVTGGWYSYRMSKAALNQVTKSLSVELGRKGIVSFSYHPGTVDTDLTRPHVRVPKEHLFTPDLAAEKLVNVILSVKGMEDNGKFYDYEKREIPW